VSAGGQLAAERDGGEGVARVAEGGEEDPALGQASSASSRIIFTRASCSNATGVVISVSTPASR
jgi:hypothetical protein